jgi:hypothetical protein
MPVFPPIPGGPAAALWAWLLSWGLWPGMPYPPGPIPEASWRFAATRDDCWRHMADATGDVFKQAANASYMMGHETDPFHHHGWGPRPGGDDQPVDVTKLRKDLESQGWSETDRHRIANAVQTAQQFASWVERARGKGA